MAFCLCLLIFYLPRFRASARSDFLHRNNKVNASKAGDFPRWVSAVVNCCCAGRDVELHCCGQKCLLEIDDDEKLVPQTGEYEAFSRFPLFFVRKSGGIFTG